VIHNTALMLIILLSVSSAPINAESSYSDSTSFSYEQSTRGSGFFSTYQHVEAQTEKYWEGYGKVQQGRVVANEGSHGSGTIDNNDVIEANQACLYDDNGDKYVSFENWSGSISANSDDLMIYSPKTIGVGNGYYKSKPIEYNSQMTEDTSLKNYNAGHLIHHELRYADSIDSEQRILINQNNNYVSYLDNDNSYFSIGPNGSATTNMHFIEDITGAVQLHALKLNQNIPVFERFYPFQGDSQYLNRKLGTPSVDINEAYTGSYQLERNITFSTQQKNIRIRALGVAAEALSCCFGGYEGLGWPEKETWGNMTCFNCRK